MKHFIVTCEVQYEQFGFWEPQVLLCSGHDWREAIEEARNEMGSREIWWARKFQVVE
jgi:hypothetical protein